MRFAKLLLQNISLRIVPFLFERYRIILNNISDVIQSLSAIVEECRVNNDPLGIFASIYKQTTVAVADAIQAGRFEDGARMERLDVIFAGRYIDAYQNFKAGKPTTRSWAIAFEAARKKRLILLQHLFAGMNAHIMLDLGIAAAQTCPGKEIPSLKNDFNTINQVLSELVDKFEGKIGDASPMIRILDKVGYNIDERLAAAGVALARDVAWAAAKRLAPLSGGALEEGIAQLDAQTEKIGKVILFRPMIAWFWLWLTRFFEPNPGKAIEILEKN